MGCGRCGVGSFTLGGGQKFTCLLVCTVTHCVTRDTLHTADASPSLCPMQSREQIDALGLSGRALINDCADPKVDPG